MPSTHDETAGHSHDHDALRGVISPLPNTAAIRARLDALVEALERGDESESRLAEEAAVYYAADVPHLCDALDTVRAECDRAEERWAEWFHRGTKAEAAIARVRALCEADFITVDDGEGGTDRIMRCIYPRAIRAVLDDES